MEASQGQRRKDTGNVLRKVSEKWLDLQAVVRTDQRLDQDEQFFQAILRLQYKKLEEQKRCHKQRRTIINQTLAEIPEISDSMCRLFRL
jgi:Ni2+-binding GTPase involved in maturation of urease and hydrogenase